MKLGLFAFATAETLPPDVLARAAEDRGFESLFLTEHSHIPTRRTTPWPGGADLPDHYRRTLDPFIALTAAASATDDLLVGTAVCLVTQRDPIQLAKEVASLDLLSNGRFVFGVSAGWNREELADHGCDPAVRWAVLRERVLAMKELWTRDEAAFRGEFVSFQSSWQWPKPVQRPHPPIYIGGSGAGALDRVLDYGDGWLPLMGRGADLQHDIRRLQQLASERGRPAVPVTVAGLAADNEIVAALSKVGVERGLISLPPLSPDDVLRLLDNYALLAAGRTNGHPMPANTRAALAVNEEEIARWPP